MNLFDTSNPLVIYQELSPEMGSQITPIHSSLDNIGSGLRTQAWTRRTVGGSGGIRIEGFSNSTQQEKFASNPDDFLAARGSHLTPFDASLLKREIKQIDARTTCALQELTKKIEELTSKIEDSKLVQRTFDGADADIDQPLDQVAEGSPFQKENVAEFLNTIADNQIVCSSEDINIAKENLKSTDPGSRAAAARALSVADPSSASLLLPNAIEIEKNRFVLSVFRGALRAAIE